MTEPALAQPAQLEALRAVLADVLRPGHFFVGPRLRLEWTGPVSEEIAWEIYRGRLLDASQTRQRQTFESWHVYAVDDNGRSAEPLLSLKLDIATGQVHVVRAIYSYAFEAYDAGDNVILSRETRRWLRELVGTLLVVGKSVADLRSAAAALVFQAVVGTSRLPLTSIEAPLPGFTLGDLAYFYQPTVGPEPLQSPLDLIDRGLTPAGKRREEAKLLEAVLRNSAADLPEVTKRFIARWQALGRHSADMVALLRTVFNEVALSPYTEFVDRALAFIRLLEEDGHVATADHADFLGFLLRHLARHLTAYDLVIYHHRGANYPDALLLDAALRALLDVAERQPDLFHGADGRLRRRAVRLALLLRRQYEGHDVPDAPTSPGENTRVLPEPYMRVPEEQILDPTRRQRKLFDAAPLPLTPVGQEILRQSLADLADPAEVREMGTALFLDRPLGIFKRPGEPDRTLLLSYVAYSPAVAARRLQELSKLAGSSLPEAPAFPIGVPLQAGPLGVRPGVVSLADAQGVASDFRLLHTTRQTVRDFCARYPIVTEVLSAEPALMVGGPHVGIGTPGTLAIFDGQHRLRLELEIDAAAGYVSNPEGEEPAGGLRVLRVSNY